MAQSSAAIGQFDDHVHSVVGVGANQPSKEATIGVHHGTPPNEVRSIEWDGVHGDLAY